MAQLRAQGEELDVAAGEPVRDAPLSTSHLRDARHLVKEMIPPIRDEIALRVLKGHATILLALTVRVYDAGLDAFGIEFYPSARDFGFPRTATLT